MGMVLFISGFPLEAKPTVHRDSAVHAEFVFNTWSDSDKVILWTEDETLTVGWYISGTVCFYGSDQANEEYWDGACYPDAPEWDSIEYRVVLEWNAFDANGNRISSSGSSRYREIITRGTLAETSSKRRIGALPGEYSPKQTIWVFYIPLDNLEITFPVPNQCNTWPGASYGEEPVFVDISSLSNFEEERLYRMYCEITYTHATWREDGGGISAYHKQTVSSEKRYALIRDIEGGSLDETPLTPFIHQKLTTDDPLPERTVTCAILDNNPNQEVEKVTISLGGEERDMKPVPGSIDRHYEKASSYAGDENARYKSLWTLNLDESEPDGFGLNKPRAPNWRDQTSTTGPPFHIQPLVVTVNATLKWGDTTSLQWEKSISVKDNDAPGTSLMFRLSPVDPRSASTLRVSEGTEDPPGKINISVSRPGVAPLTAEISDPWDYNDYVDVAATFPGQDTRISMIEGKRVWIELTPDDNIDGAQVKSVMFRVEKSRFNDLLYNSDRDAYERVLIFRRPSEDVPGELILTDHSDNIRRIKFPLEIIDTRLDVYDLDTNTRSGRK